MKTESSFLGTGWQFPPSFDRVGRAVLMSSGIEDIEQSIMIILRTDPGERIMQPEFGCNIRRMVFEVLDSGMAHRLDDVICHALLMFEPRIKDVSTSVMDLTPLEGRIRIAIEFTIINTNTRHNIVFPFYLQEGTSINTEGNTEY